MVLGPTGAGKSELGLHLANCFGGAILNFDSVQVYRGLDVGSAKLPVSDRRSIPHHLIDMADPGEDVTAGAFARAAEVVLRDVTGRGELPILVGGTGFYLRALLDGLSPAPERDDVLRARLTAVAARRPAALHRYLKLRDPAAAERIHPNDLQKLIRALEMVLLAGRPASETQSLPRAGLAGYTVLKIGLNPPRPILAERLNARAARMFAEGLVEETRKLLDSGVPSHAKALRSLGYRQASGVLDGSLALENAITECQTRTRQYAKRQMTWFRAEPGVHWLAGFGSETHIQSEAETLVSEFLANMCAG